METLKKLALEEQIKLAELKMKEVVMSSSAMFTGDPVSYGTLTTATVTGTGSSTGTAGIPTIVYPPSVYPPHTSWVTYTEPTQAPAIGMKSDATLVHIKSAMLKAIEAKSSDEELARVYASYFNKLLENLRAEYEGVR